MPYTKTFAEITKDDVALAGGKGASLGEMTAAGISVPPGFVVTAQAFEAFLAATNLNVELDTILDNVDHAVMDQVNGASETINALILQAQMPPEIAAEITAASAALGAHFVAVRSSATSEDSKDAAWAGQLESYLNVTEPDLLTSVQKCWASLFTPRAIFYRFETHLRQGSGGQEGLSHRDMPVSVAVVVQKMVDSEVSGIAFSVHPVTQDYDQLIIEAGFGLGEAIVSGSITPDSYVVEKSNWQIIDKNITVQEKGIFKVISPPARGGVPAGGGGGGGSEWRSIPKDRGEQPTLSDAEVIELAKLVVHIEQHYGFPVDVEWAREAGIFYIVQSRPITTLSPKATDRKDTYDFSWGERHSVISTESWLRGYVFLRDVIGNDNRNVFMYVKDGQVHTFNAAKDLQSALDSGEKVLDRGFLSRHLQRSAKVREEFSKLYKEEKEIDVGKSSDNQLLQLFERYQDLFDKTWAYFKVSQPEYLELAKEKLEKIIEEKNTGNDVDQVFITLTTPTELDLIKEEELAALERSLKGVSDKEMWQHAEEYPWLFFNTYDREIIHTFLKEKFRDLQNMSEEERTNRIETIHLQHEEHKKEHAALLMKFGNDPDLQYLASVFGKLAVDRLKMKAWWGGGEYLFLAFFEEVARRAGINSEQLLMGYTVNEILAFLKERKKVAAEVIASRMDLYAVSLEDGHLYFYDSQKAQRKFNELIGNENSKSSSEDKIEGVVANTGKARGQARIIVVEGLKRLLEDMERFEKGDIMVTTMTQPTMASLARKAAAIVTNEGGITSHASILAREYDIPCIVGTRVATMKIKDGDEVEVDADNGMVRILNRAE